MYGIELDTISGNIARQLYQKNTIAVKGFEDVELPDSFFDVAVGNVPFGDFKVTDKRYDKNKFLIHDYFFAKTLDKVPKIPNCNLGAKKTTSIFGEMDKGERAGYSDGYYGRENLSTDKDTVNNEYWLGYSCGYVSGRFDRENGNPSTLV